MLGVLLFCIALGAVACLALHLANWRESLSDAVIAVTLTGIAFVTAGSVAFL